MKPWAQCLRIINICTNAVIRADDVWKWSTQTRVCVAAQPCFICACVWCLLSHTWKHLEFFTPRVCNSSTVKNKMTTRVQIIRSSISVCENKFRDWGMFIKAFLLDQTQNEAPVCVWFIDDDHMCVQSDVCTEIVWSNCERDPAPLSVSRRCLFISVGEFRESVD